MTNSTSQIFLRAIGFSQVTPKKMKDLEVLWLRSKSMRRVLFVKELSAPSDRTYIKTLPALPDEDVTEIEITHRIEQSPANITRRQCLSEKSLIPRV